MGDVVYLKGKTPEPVSSDKKKVPQKGSFYCDHCYRDFFRLLANGSVNCYTCGKLITNLRVTDASSSS